MWSTASRWAVALLWCTAGCSGRTTVDAEAQALVDALQALDVAGTPARREAQLRILRSLALTDPGLVKTREQCVTVHAGLQTAEDEQEGARGALAAAAARPRDGGLPAAEAERIHAAIQRSEAARKKAAAALPACEQATRDLLLRRR